MIEVNSIDTKAGLEERFRQAFELNRSRILNGRGQPLAQMRERAIHDFTDLGFPAPKSEAWKYTPIARTLAHDYKIAVVPDTPPSLSRADIAPFLVDGLDADLAVLVNGAFAPALSSIGSEHLTVTPLLDAVDNPVFRRHFGTRTAEVKEVFASLNTAFTRYGLFVHASKSSRGTLHILNVNAGTTDVFLQPRHLVVVDEDSDVTVIESHVGTGEAVHFTNAVVEAFVGPRGRLDYYRLQNDAGMSAVTNTYVYQDASSYSSCSTITLAGKTIRNNVNVLPDAGFCESHLVGLFICRGDMHVDSHTLVDHAQPDCFSNELYKGILDDASRGVFNGKVLVRRDAQRTNAYQSSKSIVLSDRASMNAKPELEIYADDVKCSHGATTGRLDAEALFYLRSRGLSEQRARTVLLLAFARDVLENVQNEPLRELLDRTVESRLA